jgi:hypothetical protein
MTIGHGRWRRRVSLLAFDALEASERAATDAHLRGCRRCAEELEGRLAARRLLDDDPVARAALPVSFEALEARVRARLHETAGTPAAASTAVPWTARLLSPLSLAASAAALAAVVGALLYGPWRAAEPPATAAVTPEEAGAAATPASEELMRRMERSLVREQAARYLNEAQDVLVTVTASPPPCPKGMLTVEIEDETRRSRELLARRALVELGRDEVASAQPVLAEVEQMLREVAALPSCVRPGRLQALEREIGRRRLLMKIDLMTRELQG